MRVIIIAALVEGALSTATCCWSKWGDANSCSGYSGSGGLCNTDWTKHCSSNGDCPTSPVPTPAPTPPGPTPPPPPPTPSPPAPPVPPHPPAPPSPPLPEKSSQEVLGWLENWGPDVSWWNNAMPGHCLMGCFKPAPFLSQTAPYSTINYGFVFLTRNPDAAQVGCGAHKPAGDCPAWDGQNIYIAAATKQGAVAVNSNTNIDAVSPGILSIADAVRMARMHPSGPKRMKITLGGWSDYGRFGSAANGIKAANLMAKLVAFTFADGVDLDLEHLTPFSALDDEFGALIAFITQLRTRLNALKKSWARNANARIKALTVQAKNARTPLARHWYATNIRHLKEVAAMDAPHLEICWTTRFNAFLPSDEPSDQWNYLMPDSPRPDPTFRFATDNEGSRFWPQVAHLVDTVNIMAYDASSPGGGLKLNFTAILDNFVRYGNVSASKINMGFEPGRQATGAHWEGEALDEATAQVIASKHIGGGVALWAVNPSPSKFSNSSKLCPVLAKAVNEIIKPTYAYGKAPKYTKCGSDGMWPGLDETETEAIIV